MNHIDKSQIDDKMKKYISVISSESTKIESLSKFVTNANFDLTASEIKADVVQFICDYINEIYLPNTPVINSSLKIAIEKSLDIIFCESIIPNEHGSVLV